MDDTTAAALLRELTMVSGQTGMTVSSLQVPRQGAAVILEAEIID